MHVVIFAIVTDVPDGVVNNLEASKFYGSLAKGVPQEKMQFVSVSVHSDIIVPIHIENLN